MHKNVGREIRIYLVKGLKCTVIFPVVNLSSCKTIRLIYYPNSTGYSWLRLIKPKEKNLLISYNPDHIYETNHVEKTYDSKNNYFYTYLDTKYGSANEER